MTFTFDQDTTHRRFDGKIPLGDRLVEILGTVVVIVGGLAVVWN
ncbi:hypothetical protein ABZX12_14045 [Kribbella sp. NPDC003505]